MYPVHFNEITIILIGLGVIILVIALRKRSEYTFSLRKWIILLVLGAVIYAISKEPYDVLPKFTIPILALVGLLILLTW